MENYEAAGKQAAKEAIRLSNTTTPVHPKQHVLDKAKLPSADALEAFLRGWAQEVEADKTAQSKWDSHYSRTSEVPVKVRRVSAKTQRATTQTQRLRTAALRIAAEEQFAREAKL